MKKKNEQFTFFSFFKINKLSLKGTFFKLITLCLTMRGTEFQSRRSPEFVEGRRRMKFLYYELFSRYTYSMEIKALIFIVRIPRYIASGVIRIYQFLLSTDHAFWARPDIFRICTYHPSCSEFARLAILKHGVILGSLMGIKRVIDCNPFSRGGYDPVPRHFTLRRYRGKNAKPA